MTTRKTLALPLVTLLAGCATPGVLHVYSLAPGEHATVHDAGGPAPAEVPSFLDAADELTGFAYDPYTDHFFLRLAPGNRIRVVDRPARAIKREFEIAGAPTSGGGDLAVKPLSGHLFLLHPTEPAVIETTRLGELVRTIALADLATPAVGIAYDANEDQLLVLARDGKKILRYTLAGEPRGQFTLERAVGPALGFDSVQREVYAPVADGIGVFGEDGTLRRTLPGAAPTVDVGPRSFIRVF